MHAAQIATILAFAGQTLALALPGNPFWNHGNNDNAVIPTAAPAAQQQNGNVHVVTMYTTITLPYGGFQQSKPTATAAPQQPRPTTSVAAQPTSAPSNPGSSTGYMAIVDEWRSKMQLSSLTQDSKLEGNALKTAQDGNGQMVHELNPGTFAQVLAPGSSDEFEHVFVGGWLCEMPNLTGLDGICSSMSQGWSYNGQTGHAEILSDSKYSKIGCALADGIWACDLA